MSKEENEDFESDFYGEEIKGENILQDGTYYTDVVEEKNNRKKIVIAGIIVLIVAFIVIMGFVGKRYIIDNPEDRVKEPAATETVVEKPEEYTPDYKAPAKPVQQLMPNVETSEDTITAFVEGNNIQTSDGTSLSIKDATVKKTVNECVVEKTSDFCNVAEISINDKQYYAYYFKNATTSLFFENPANFQEVGVNNVAASAQMSITALDGSETPILLTLNENGSGLMFIPADNNAESLTSLQQNINAE